MGEMYFLTMEKFMNLSFNQKKPRTGYNMKAINLFDFIATCVIPILNDPNKMKKIALFTSLYH